MTTILRKYSEHGIDLKTVKLKLPRGTTDVHLSKELVDRLDPIARRIGEQFRLYGFRAKINFRCLLKCLAYRNRRKTVTDDDFDEFLELSDYMNFEFNPL